jgi:spermidine/putrescine transport system permease protein
MTPTTQRPEEFHGRQRPTSLTAWLLFAPLLLWLAVFVIAPTTILFVYSFCQRDELGQVVFSFSLENYQHVFARTDEFREPPDPAALNAMSLPQRMSDYLDRRVYLKIFLHSIIYAGLTTIICILAGYPVAYFIGTASEHWRNRLLLLIMIPFWTSFLIRTYAWITILKDEGLLNSLLRSTGLIVEPLELLYTPLAVMIGLVYTFLPFMVLPIYGSVEKLDRSLIEAAFDLGATPWRAFWRVILPLTKPGLRAGALLVFVPALGIFAINDILGAGKVDMIGNVIQRQFGQASNLPFGAALGMTLVILFCLAYWFSMRKQPVS